MNKLFYAKLAATNIGKNRKTYIPYILTCIITVAMFYIIKSLSLNEGISSLRGGATIESMLYLGCWIVAIFAVIFLFYTNSFLIKRRKKEFGLFNILGMEKKHLSRVIGIETLYIAVIGLVLGIGVGILLDKAMYLLILKILGGEITLGFYISWESMWQTFLLFGAIFILIFLNSLRQVPSGKADRAAARRQRGGKGTESKLVYRHCRRNLLRAWVLYCRCDTGPDCGAGIFLQRGDFSNHWYLSAVYGGEHHAFETPAQKQTLLL